MIVVDIRDTETGQVTRLEGNAVAVMCGTVGELPYKDQPVVSLRTENAGHMAWLMAGLLAVLYDNPNGKQIVDEACDLSNDMDAGDPVFRIIHKRSGEPEDER